MFYKLHFIHYLHNIVSINVVCVVYVGLKTNFLNGIGHTSIIQLLYRLIQDYTASIQAYTASYIVNNG